MRVLLLEDDHSLARMMTEILIHNGHELDHASNLDHAIKLMNGHNVVVLDVLLGDGHLGSELMHLFKCPVVLFTSLDARGLRDMGVDPNGSGRQIYHVMKPNSPRKIMDCLESVVIVRDLLERMLTEMPDNEELAEATYSFRSAHAEIGLHERDLKLLDRWLDLPPLGKTEEANAPYLELLDDVRTYLGKK